MATHYDIFRLATVESTQDEARSRRDGNSAPVLVVADEQISGRGRQGRVWSQPDRGVFASLSFASHWTLSARTLIPLIAGVAMRRAILDRFDIDVGLKWPNDLMFRADKVGGILAEMSDASLVVGCGVNLWWADPVQGAGALFTTDPGTDAAAALAESWASGLLEIIEDGPKAWPRIEYEHASVTIGQDVWWDEGHGRATGIADGGGLIVRKDGTEVTLHSGAVHMRDRG
jgi:BirA family biotin operon repressor/biotin-[acetyl-CoA-carboxylase] ligase